MKVVTVVSLALIVGISAHAATFSLKGTVFEKAGKEFDVDPVLLYSIALVESAVEVPSSKGFLKPFPWTLRSQKPFYGTSRKQAEAQLIELLKTQTSVDVGLMQINTKWHGHRVKSPTQLLDPLTNVRIAAQIVSENIRATNDAELAIGRYHNFEPNKARWYARYVLRVYTQIKQRKTD